MADRTGGGPLFDRGQRTLASQDVPQSSHLDRVLQVTALLAQGTRPGPAHFGVSQRQLNYDLQTARVLGLVSAQSVPLPSGHAVLDLPEDARLGRLALAFEQATCGQAWLAWSSATSLVELGPATAEDFLRQRATVQGKTRGRRAGTLTRLCRVLRDHHPLRPRELPGESFGSTPKVDTPSVFARRESGRVLRQLGPGARFVRAATAYFTVYGYDVLAEPLSEAHLHLLLGSPEARAVLEDTLTAWHRSIVCGPPTPRKREAMSRLRAELVRGTSRVRHLLPRATTGLHAKVVIYDRAAAFVGSANLTGGGLSHNVEAGQVVTDSAAVDHFAERFDVLFERAEDILMDVLEPLERAWDLAPLAPPFLVYLRALLELYGRIPELSTPARYELAAFQQLIVGTALRALEEHRGTLLISPTGTGKTVMGAFVAAAMMEQRLVDRIFVVPPNDTIADSWESMLFAFGHTARVVNHGRLQGKGKKTARSVQILDELMDGVGERDLVIVDECHAFRNPTRQGYKALKRLVHPRDGRSGPYRLLLTATPISKGLPDLNTLISLVEPKRRLQQTREVATTRSVVNVSLPFIIREFGEALPGSTGRPLRFGGQSLHFPHVGVRTERYLGHMGPTLKSLAALPVQIRLTPKDTSQLGLSLGPDPGEDPGEVRDANAFLRFLLMKRAESSPAALRNSLLRLKESFTSWKLQVAHPEVLVAAIEEILAGLETQVGDSKLECLVRLFDDIPRRDRVLLFSSYTDTVHYLETQLRQRLPGRRIGVVTGVVPKKEKQARMERFAPRAHGQRRSRKDLDILICTDTLSEGVNLQDATHLINYDLHWTPLRLIQRVGRIDRPTRKERRVEVRNFFPGEQTFEELVGLMKRLSSRSEAYRSLAGTEVLIDHDRDLADLDEADIGAVESLYQEDMSYGDLLEKTLPTSAHLTTLAQATEAEIRDAWALASGARAARSGEAAGTFALLDDAGRRSWVFAPQDAPQDLQVAPERLAPERVLARIRCASGEAGEQAPSGLDTALAALVTTWAELAGLDPDTVRVVCAMAVLD